MTEQTVKILMPSLDEASNPPVLRGIIDPHSIANLKVDHSYQRESLSKGSRREIILALETGLKLPDIELGMRGQEFQMTDNTALYLVDPVYVIDGYQRWVSVKEHYERFPDDVIRLGAAVHFGTTSQYERDRFHALNLFRARVSPSVLLRNCKEENRPIATLYGLSQGNGDRGAVMHGRVCWLQNMMRGQLVTGLTFCQIALLLHGHFRPVPLNSVRDIPDAMIRLERTIGLPHFRNNVIAFWELIDAAWGIRAVPQKDGASYLKTGFLRVLTRIVSDHCNFWSTAPDEKRLQIPSDLRRKLARFPVNDPEIIRLSGASGKVTSETLYFHLASHLNSGKRTGRLKNRYGLGVPQPINNPELDEDEENANG